MLHVYDLFGPRVILNNVFGQDSLAQMDVETLCLFEPELMAVFLQDIIKTDRKVSLGIYNKVQKK